MDGVLHPAKNQDKMHPIPTSEEGSYKGISVSGLEPTSRMHKMHAQPKEAELNFIAVFEHGGFKRIEAVVIEVCAIGAAHIHDLHPAVVGQAQHGMDTADAAGIWHKGR